MNENSTAIAHNSIDRFQILDSNITKQWMIWAVALFFLASVFGSLMRLYYIVEIPLLEYLHLLHAHSHVAQLGWAFLLVTLALLILGLDSTPHQKHYVAVLVLNVVAGFGMAAAFLYQGYGFVSIGFSTLHLLVSYYFAWLFWSDLKRLKPSSSRSFFKVSLIWLILSSFGLWALPIILNTVGKTSILYYSSVQWFLHIQFNGWFTYAVIGLLLVWLSRRGQHKPIPGPVFWCLHASVLLTYALSVSWANPHPALFYLNSLGVVLQLFAIGYILWALKDMFSLILARNKLSSWLIGIGLFSLIMKVLTQSALVIPAVADISHTIRNFVIGFIHLTMLGSITLTTAGLLVREGYFPTNTVSRLGWAGILVAFLSTEFLLFLQGIWVWMAMGFFTYYYELIFLATILFPISILVVLFGFLKKNLFSNYKQNQTTMKNLTGILTIALLLFLFSCGGSEGGGDATSSKSSSSGSADEATSAETATSSKGVGEIKNLDLDDSLNVSMVFKGKQIVEMKCASCHKLTDKRVVGPGFEGVTNRRQPEWIMNMITNVDVMLEEDPTARKLLEECLTRMPNQGLSTGDARDVLEFLRQNDEAKLGKRDEAYQEG